MKKIVPLCVFVLALSFFVGVLLDLGYYCFFGPGLWHPTIVCDNPIQNLGKLSGDRPVPCEFVIRNAGTRPLIIEKARPGCGSCVQVVSVPHAPILPEQQGVVRAAMLTKSLKKGLARKTLAIFSNDPEQPVLVLRIQASIETTTER